MSDLTINRALGIIELAAYHVRDAHWRQQDHDGNLIGNAFDEFAQEIAALGRQNITSVKRDDD